MTQSTSLTVLDNFLGTEIKTPREVEDSFRLLSGSQVQELAEAFRAFDVLWTPPADKLGSETMHVGRAYDTFRNPLSWVPKYCEVNKHLELDFIARLLLYYPKVSIWTPEMREQPEFFVDSPDARAKGEVAALARRLVALRPFLEDGSVRLIPDTLYVQLSEWQAKPSSFSTFRAAILRSSLISATIKERVLKTRSDTELHQLMLAEMGPNAVWIEDLDFADPADDRPSKLLRIARTDAARADLRAILDEIDFLPEGADFCSDDRYMWGKRNEEAIRYINPLNEINEDVLVQRLLGCSALCANRPMLDLLRYKYSGEVASSRDMVWENVSVQLPALRDIPVEDIVRVRRSEDAFQVWRDSLTKALRTIELNIDSHELSERDVQAIFREETLPAAMALEAKAKTTSLSKVVRSAGASFVSGAAAGLLLNPEPLIAVASGAVTAVIKGVMDAAEAKHPPKEAPLIRLFSAIAHPASTSSPR